jgi:hypothetical protein
MRVNFKGIQFAAFVTLFCSSPAHAGEGLAQISNTPTYLIPSLAVNYALGVEAPGPVAAGNFQKTFDSLSIWMGVALHPVPQEQSSPYLAVGFEMAFWTLPDGGQEQFFMPMARLGLSIPLVDDSFASVMLPAISFYGMAGIRPPGQTVPAAGRLGLGASSIWIPLAVIESGMLVPGVIEGLLEVGEGHRQFIFRFGMGF